MVSSRLVPSEIALLLLIEDEPRVRRSFSDPSVVRPNFWPLKNFRLVVLGVILSPLDMLASFLTVREGSFEDEGLLASLLAPLASSFLPRD